MREGILGTENTKYKGQGDGRAQQMLTKVGGVRASGRGGLENDETGKIHGGQVTKEVPARLKS